MSAAATKQAMEWAAGPGVAAAGRPGQAAIDPPRA